MEPVDFTQAPKGATHFLRYDSGHVVWCCVVEDGQNGQPIVKEWDSFNQYWVPCIHAAEHYYSIGMQWIADPVDPSPASGPLKAPKGATHRYEHGGLISWYLETDLNGLFVWRDGSWHGAAFKNTKDLMESCMLGKVTLLAMEQEEPGTKSQDIADWAFRMGVKPGTDPISVIARGIHAIEQAEPAEDDLTWLARNLHAWPGEITFPIDHELFKAGAQFYTYYVSLISVFTSRRVNFNKAQWLARRAELQNKPSFADHSDAKCFVQDGYGNWLKNTLTSSAEVISDFWRATPSDGFVFICAGTILGDWRDTLEQRPADLSESAVTERLTEATQNVLAAAPALMDEKYILDHSKPAKPRNKYQREIRPGVFVDVYDVLKAFAVTDPALQHLIKKALCAGLRGHKSRQTDLQDIIDSALRAKELDGGAE